MRNMVAQGSGVAIIDSMNGCAALNDGVIWRPFEPAVHFDLDVITRADAALQAPAREILELTVDRLRQHETLPGAVT